MDGNLFCGGTDVGETAFIGLPGLLVVAAYALCLAVYMWERGVFRRFWADRRETWTSWPPAVRVIMVGLLLTCVRDGRCTKPRDVTNSPAAIVWQPATQEGQAAGAPAAAPSAPSNQTSGGAAAMPAGAGAPAPALPALADGTNCWWIAEGRSPADTDTDGMPDAWERIFGLDPLDPSDAAGDRDRDGLTALEEFLNRTHPRRRDTDGDGMPDAWEAAHRPFLCPWLPDDALDADEDGLDNFHEYALGCDPGDPDTNDDGRPDGEEADAGVNPALAPADWAAYGTALFSVRVDGLRAARRAGVSVGHITHSGVQERSYAIAAGYRYPLTVVDLDPGNTVPCAGTVRITHDNATFIHGFTNEFPVTFPLSTNAPACPPGTEMTVAGIDLDIPDIICLGPDNSASFSVSASFVPDGEEIAGQPQWSVSGGTATPESGSMETWVNAVFPAPAQQAQGGPALMGAGTNGPPSVTAEIGDRTVTRTLEPSTPGAPDESDPWDGLRFIASPCSGTEPVTPTYALAHSDSTVRFSWRGHWEDEVLEWTIDGNGPRFIKNGQEVSRVTRDLSVSVLPRGEVANATIRAKVRTKTGEIVTRRTELRVITIIAEPVLSFDPGALVNPSGLFVGGSATFQITFSSNVDEDDVQWSVANGKAAFVFGSQGTASRVVVGLAPGTETLTAEIAHFVDSSPQFTFEVYPEANPIPIHFMFICDNNGNHAGSASDIPGLITGVNDIYRQAGIRFAQASVTYTNEIFWYLNSDMIDYQKDIINAMTGTEGLEAYIVPNIATNVAGKNFFNKGLLMTNTVSAHILAHEIGHQCGWEDIYTAVSNQPPLTMPLSKSHLSPADWNNGPGPQEYYQRGLPLATVIRRCLMFGYTSGGNDIPTGPIKGYSKEGEFGPVRVGTQGMDRFPKHKE
jgi:hypothetical protein